MSFQNETKHLSREGATRSSLALWQYSLNMKPRPVSLLQIFLTCRHSFQTSVVPDLKKSGISRESGGLGLSSPKMTCQFRSDDSDRSDRRCQLEALAATCLILSCLRYYMSWPGNFQHPSESRPGEIGVRIQTKGKRRELETDDCTPVADYYSLATIPSSAAGNRW